MRRPVRRGESLRGSLCCLWRYSRRVTRLSEDPAVRAKLPPHVLGFVWASGYDSERARRNSRFFRRSVDARSSEYCSETWRRCPNPLLYSKRNRFNQSTRNRATLHESIFTYPPSFRRHLQSGCSSSVHPQRDNRKTVGDASVKTP